MAPLWRTDSTNSASATSSSPSSSFSSSSSSSSSGIISSVSDTGGSCVGTRAYIAGSTTGSTCSSSSASGSTSVSDSGMDSDRSSESSSGDGQSGGSDIIHTISANIDLEARPDRSPTAQLRHANWGASSQFLWLSGACFYYAQSTIRMRIGMQSGLHCALFHFVSHWVFQTRTAPFASMVRVPSLICSSSLFT